MSGGGEDYGRSVGGRLTLKGGLELSRSKKHKKKHKKHKKQKREREDGEDEDGGAAEEPEQQIVILKGTGRISSSGTAVRGHEGSRFMKEMDNGDAIIITHPTTLVDETRIVNMVLSDVSLSISSAFSSDLISTTEFRYVKVPKKKEEEDALKAVKKRKKDLETEKEAFGTFAGDLGSTFVYRVKKAGAAGGYAIHTESMDGGGLSREELLDMRTKKVSDRFCG